MPESDSQKQPDKLYAMPHLFVVILCPWPDHSNFACYGPEKP